MTLSEIEFVSRKMANKECLMNRDGRTRPEPKLVFILQLIATLTKEQEMLQPDTFCEHTM